MSDPGYCCACTVGEDHPDGDGNAHVFDAGTGACVICSAPDPRSE